MQFKQFFIAFFACVFLFTACKKDDEMTNPPIEEPPVEDNTFLIQTTLSTGEVIDFNFGECFFNDTLQRVGGGVGTSGSGANMWNTKSFSTIIYNRNEDLTVENYLKMDFNFKQLASDGEIDKTAIENILNTEMNSDSSSYFQFEVTLKLNDELFKNNTSIYDISNNQTIYTYIDGFNYEITDYEVGYQADCLEEEGIKLKGNFNGNRFFILETVINLKISAFHFSCSNLKQPLTQQKIPQT